MSGLDFLFKPKSVAIVGASDNPAKLGSILLSNLIEAKYSGKIYPVNPKHKQLQGYRVYPSVEDIPQNVNLVCIAIPAPGVISVIKQAAKRQAKAVVIISAGFKETGIEGQKLETELIKLCHKYKIRVLGPNCLGLITPSANVNLSFAASKPIAGDIAFLSQSGAFCTAILDMSLESNLGFSHFVSLGNKSDLNEIDIFEEWLKDDQVKVIAAYLEEIADGQKLLELVDKYKHKKPIIIFKPGKTEAARQAIASHTGSVSGSAVTIHTALKQAGIIEANEINHLFSLMQTFSWGKLPEGNKIAVITNAGGPGVIATDVIIANGLVLSELEIASKIKLQNNLPASASVKNPIDVIGDALAERFKIPIEVVSEDPQVDAMVFIITPQLVTQIEDTAKLIINSSKLTNKPVLAVFLGGKYIRSGLQLLYDNKIPAFRYISDAVESLAALHNFAQQQKKRQTSFAEDLLAENLDKGKYSIELMLKQTRQNVISTEDSISLLKEAGIKMPEQIITSDLQTALDFAALNYPVVIKAPSELLIHKTEKKAVYLNIDDPQELIISFGNLQNTLKTSPQDKISLLVQKQIKANEELFIGAQRDGNKDVYQEEVPGFGHLLVFGKGGIYTEVLHDLAYALAPASQKEIEQALSKTHVYQILKGLRGKQPLAINKYLQTILAVQKLVLMYPQIISLDLNPVLISSHEVWAADAKIFIG